MRLDCKVPQTSMLTHCFIQERQHGRVPEDAQRSDSPDACKHVDRRYGATERGQVDYQVSGTLLKKYSHASWHSNFSVGFKTRSRWLFCAHVHLFEHYLLPAVHFSAYKRVLCAFLPLRGNSIYILVDEPMHVNLRVWSAAPIRYTLKFACREQFLSGHVCAW